MKTLKEVLTTIKEGEVWIPIDEDLALQSVSLDEYGCIKLSYSDSYNNALYIDLQDKFVKNITFDEVLQSELFKCRVEHPLIRNEVNNSSLLKSMEINKNYFTLADILSTLSYYFNSVDIKTILREGKWYIK